MHNYLRKDASPELFELADKLLSVPPTLRPELLRRAIASLPNDTSNENATLQRIRLGLRQYWEAKFQVSIPTAKIRSLLEPPIPLKTVMRFSQLAYLLNIPEMKEALFALVNHLQRRLTVELGTQQLALLDWQTDRPVSSKLVEPTAAENVRSLSELIEKGRKFPTVYADPPWNYCNKASRAAAVNHYPTMSLDEICSEPVQELTAENAHLHLWTTSGFLPQAFKVMEAWGFTYKSSFVWLKDEMGMGNYWRLSHELLLLGVRGKLLFRDHTLCSWIHASRTQHSRKPGIVRLLIEQASPGPYLELYGREELRDSEWTVYGNQVERRLF